MEIVDDRKNGVKTRSTLCCELANIPPLKKRADENWEKIFKKTMSTIDVLDS